MNDLHPPAPFPVRVTLPPSFVVCPECGGHYVAADRPVRTEFCREDRWIWN